MSNCMDLAWPARVISSTRVCLPQVTYTKAATLKAVHSIRRSRSFRHVHMLIVVRPCCHPYCYTDSCCPRPMLSTVINMITRGEDKQRLFDISSAVVVEKVSAKTSQYGSVKEVLSKFAPKAEMSKLFARLFATVFCFGRYHLSVTVCATLAVCAGQNQKRSAGDVTYRKCDFVRQSRSPFHE